MLHLSAATPERFSALAPNPTDDLERLLRHLARGAVIPEHLLVVADGADDVGRVGIITLPDGNVLAYAWQVISDGDPFSIYQLLMKGVAEAGRFSDMTTIYTTVIDADQPHSEAMRVVLAASSWKVDGERLELETTPYETAPGEDVVEISPYETEVVEAMAAAMSDSLDDYDQGQVKALGATAAAKAYRDMMASVGEPLPWYAHQGSEGITGVAAVQPYPGEWCLGYLGVIPTARRQGLGTALTRAMLSGAARAGVNLATASVAVANTPIRATLSKVGFETRSRRTDFALHLD